MTHKKNGMTLAGPLLIGMLLMSACTQSYSQAPKATPTLIPTSLFVSPFPSLENPMEKIEEFARGTATAAAQTVEAAGLTPGTPGTETPSTATLASGTAITPQTGTTSTPSATSVAVTPATVTPATPGTVIVPTVPQGRPATYTLQKGEFPYCIARRFNVDPIELLAINGLVGQVIFLPDLILKIPQSGAFPDDRALHYHPDTYTVSSSDETLYSVACYYGDVFPESIARANNLSLASPLSFGQRLSIP